MGELAEFVEFVLVGVEHGGYRSFHFQINRDEKASRMTVRMARARRSRQSHGWSGNGIRWKQKSPAEAGLFLTSAELLGGADDFDINADGQVANRR